MELSSVRYARTVAGAAQLFSLLCVVPLDHGLYQQAMASLHAEARLKPNEVLENIRTDDDPSCFLVLGIRSLTVSADVYDLTPEHAAATAPAPAAAPEQPRPSAAMTYGAPREAPPVVRQPSPPPLPTGDYTQCNTAFDRIADLARLWAEWFGGYPLDETNAVRTSFNRICGRLSDETQQCLIAAYGRAHRDACAARLKALPTATRGELDALLVRPTEGPE